MANVSQPELELTKASKASVSALFSYGFRPFFLGASLFSVLLMSVWIVWLTMIWQGGKGDWLPVAGSAYPWHAHEMIFGYAGAAMAGFLLTAIPNWTGALPLSGPPLAFLFAVWLSGRCVMAASGLLPYALVASVDIAFLPVLGAFAARQLFVRPAARNLVFLGILAFLTLENARYHLAVAGVVALDPLEAVRTALLIVTVMIAIIGGRIIPAFTHNWLHLNRPGEAMPRRVTHLDAAAVLSVVLVAALKLAGAPQWSLGAAALAAAALNAWRLVLWGGWAARPDPIVWILHAGYAWLAAGLGLMGLAGLMESVPETLAFHALGAGAIGTMTLAIMTRASLGHTGRPIKAPLSIVWAYHLVIASAVLRVAGPVVAPAHQGIALALAALFWIVAFGLFAAVYAPILTTPRVHTKVAHRA
jgi:uncharacterized protein involved in response to NO